MSTVNCHLDVVNFDLLRQILHAFQLSGYKLLTPGQRVTKFGLRSSTNYIFKNNSFTTYLNTSLEIYWEVKI